MLMLVTRDPGDLALLALRVVAAAAGLSLPLRGYHWVALLWICFVLDTVAAVRLPGVAWSKPRALGGLRTGGRLAAISRIS